MLCMKYQMYLCEQCLKCRDPNLYCKFRSSCPISFLEKERKGEKEKDIEAPIINESDSKKESHG